MQAAETESTGTQNAIVSPKKHRRKTYSKVMDKRKHPIRGLWERNAGKFYAPPTKAANTPAKELMQDGNRAIIYCSTTDPYQMFKASTADRTQKLNARAEQLVRNSLEIIRDNSDVNVRILTRSPLARNHFDLFKSYGDRLLFGMSLPTMNDKLCKFYEPNAPSPQARLKALQAAREAGLNVFVAMAPRFVRKNKVIAQKLKKAVFMEVF
jgi:DNA repair photolyase